MIQNTEKKLKDQTNKIAMQEIINVDDPNSFLPVLE